jgi:hypothetical protein
MRHREFRATGEEAMDNGHSPMAGSTVTVSRVTAVMALAVMLFVGIAAGRSLTENAVGAALVDLDATATRTAELDELNQLRTQAAQSGTCVPAGSPVATEPPSPTATPTPVPPAAMGQEIAYGDDWTVVVTSFTPAPPSDEVTASGKFLQVSVTVTNHGKRSRPFPFTDWVLVDETGRTFVMDYSATRLLVGGAPFFGLDPSLEKHLAVVFDVALDAGPRFVLESATYPAFRVALELQMHG